MSKYHELIRLFHPPFFRIPAVSSVYVLNGTHDGRPIYTEQNKFDNTQYNVKTGALIRYCSEERAWVFMHEHIRKDNNTRDSVCPWLLRSPETDSFNLLEVSGDWVVWTGVINNGATFQTYCNLCDSEAGESSIHSLSSQVR